MKHFLISCGGTGGHLSPGIALAEGLTGRGYRATLLISHKKVDGRLAEKYPHFQFVRLPSAPFSWKPVALARFLWNQARGFLFSVRRIRALRPDGIVGFGGFTTVAVVAAGALGGTPVVLHEANRVPGRAIRALGRLARRVYLPPGVRLSSVSIARQKAFGLPVRSEIRRSPKEAARARLGLDAAHKLVAVFGGSQGASALNHWAEEAAAGFAQEGISLYVVTGLGKGEPHVREFRSRNGQPVRAHFVPFSDAVADVLSAADVVVSRAGAGTIAELIRCGAPAILVPFPFAADDHQRANARFFEQQGGGFVVDQKALPLLRAEVIDLVFNDGLLKKFRTNLGRMERENSLDLILDDLDQLTTPAPKAPAPVPA